MKPIEKAIAAAGNANRLAKGIGVPPQSVIFWRDGVRKIPAEYCPRIEVLTGVKCEALRPDVQWDVLTSRDSAKATTRVTVATQASSVILQSATGTR